MLGFRYKFLLVILALFIYVSTAHATNRVYGCRCSGGTTIIMCVNECPSYRYCWYGSCNWDGTGNSPMPYCSFPNGYPDTCPGQHQDKCNNAVGEMVTIPIPSPPSTALGCGETIWSQEALSGERLEIQWICPSGNNDDAFYDFVYKGSGREGAIGRCHYFHGANHAYYIAPKVIFGDKPDFFIRTGWTSIDGYMDDNDDGCLEKISHYYDVCNDKYSRFRYGYEYADGCNPVSEENTFTDFKNECRDFQNWPLCGVEHIDPPLGPETEVLFDELFAESQEFLGVGPSVMGQWSQSPCDINFDGDCNDQDQRASYLLAGACFEDEGFNSFADVDGDGCITIIDIELLFPEANSPDSDSDGMPDVWENLYGLDDFRDNSGEDFDYDGVTDLEEYRHLTNPNDSDTDHDGYTDGEEILAGTNPLDPESPPPSNQPPVANAGLDQTLQCTEPSGASVTLDGSASFDPDDDILSYLWTGSFGAISGSRPALTLSIDSHVITLEVDDNRAGSDSDIVNITVQDTISPTLEAPDDITEECTTPNGQEVNIGAPSVDDICSENIVVSNDALELFVLGLTNVTWSAEDEFGNISQVTHAVNIIDTIPPDISISCSPDTLWPPNHKMIEVVTEITANDICDALLTIELDQITMNEGEEINAYDPNYDEGLGDGNTVNDILVSDDGRIYLRAERSGRNLDGRIYTITYKATDTSGNTSRASCEVSVLHDQGDAGK